jgi:hypothetical protein
MAQHRRHPIRQVSGLGAVVTRVSLPESGQIGAMTSLVPARAGKLVALPRDQWNFNQTSAVF